MLGICFIIFPFLSFTVIKDLHAKWHDWFNIYLFRWARLTNSRWSNYRKSKHYKDFLSTSPLQQQSRCAWINWPQLPKWMRWRSWDWVWKRLVGCRVLENEAWWMLVESPCSNSWIQFIHGKSLCFRLTCSACVFCGSSQSKCHSSAMFDDTFGVFSIFPLNSSYDPQLYP